MAEKRERRKRGSKKWRQSAKHKASGKYRLAFIRCVRRTGRWRGKKATLDQSR